MYRETVIVNKPLTLDGQGAAEIRGSDIWTQWTRSGSYWVGGSTPSFTSIGECSGNTTRCRWPEQVFVDGVPLTQVAANPAPGEFAIDGARQVVLPSDPTGRTVEVSVRDMWIIGKASNVVIQGFTMKHAATPAQWGAISFPGTSGWVVQNNRLSDAHGAVISFRDATNVSLLNNDISRGGELGVHGSNASNVIIRGNRIYNNNTELFNTGWEAGGMKMATVSNVTVDSNEVDNNDGPGVWCDIDCTGVTITNNRIHDNGNSGIIYELSNSATVSGNNVWGNGWGWPDWAWGAAILVQNSSNVDVVNNVVAWNADGVAVVSQNRGGNWTNQVNISVRDNALVGSGGGTLLGWFQDWNGVLYDQASNNRGANNRYWAAEPDGAWGRFEWAGPVSKLADFNPTPGEENGQYMSVAARDAVLTAAGVPTAPSR